MLCEAFRQNGMWMGQADTKHRDSREFSQKIPEIRYLVESGFRYGDAAGGEQAEMRSRLDALVAASRDGCADPEGRPAFGWKRAITTFTIDIFLDAFPEGKIVHLLRDGRDCMLSRLDERMRALDDPFNRLVVFGDAHVREYAGEPLTQETVEKYRNEIEMTHWNTVLEFGLRGRRHPDRYLEVKYEDLCLDPAPALGRVFQFLDVPYRQQARDWIVANAYPASIGKWRGREAELADAIKIGEPLLRELGYW